MRENCTYGSMRGSRRKTAKSVLRVVEDRAGVPDKGRSALLYTLFDHERRRLGRTLRVPPLVRAAPPGVSRGTCVCRPYGASHDSRRTARLVPRRVRPEVPLRRRVPSQGAEIESTRRKASTVGASAYASATRSASGRFLGLCLRISGTRC